VKTIGASSSRVYANVQTRTTLTGRLHFEIFLALLVDPVRRCLQSQSFTGVCPMLFDPFSACSLQLANRMVMAPLTRSRATTQHTPNALMAVYYGQRATAGLIITEGTSPSPNGLGYPRIPGLYDTAQVDAWKASTKAVHDQGGKIFVQFMHCGRVAHVANLPAGAEVLGPGTTVCPGHRACHR
jgi:2,4-dienoyl-CoA reductase-like NADH-dependent reductase (Old Yellow Enzyme family)